MNRSDLQPPSIPNKQLLLWGLIAPLCLFGRLALGVARHETFPFDRSILLFLHHHASPLVDAAMLLFTRIGSSYVLLPFSVGILVMLLWRKQPARAAFWAVGVGGAYLVDFVAKLWFARVRPALWVSIAPESTFSFPSGHAMHSMAVAAALAALVAHTRLARPVILVGTFFVLGIGLSRIYLGVHYPSDVIAGWAASLAWIVGLSYLLEIGLPQASVR